MTYIPRRLRERVTPAVIVVPHITPEDAERIKAEWIKRAGHMPIVLGGSDITYHPAERSRSRNIR